MLGYWHNDDADAETILPGRWIRTGDFGRLEDGVLYIASRLRDLIIRGGENIYPFEIEYRLDEHPDVIEAAVFGVDHAVYGQEVKAVVVVSAGATLDRRRLQALLRRDARVLQGAGSRGDPHRALCRATRPARS